MDFTQQDQLQQITLQEEEFLQWAEEQGGEDETEQMDMGDWSYYFVI